METCTWLVILLAFCQLHATPINQLTRRNELGENDFKEDNMTTVEIIRNRGYPGETYTVITPDGYIIEMHRIPYGKRSPPAHNKPVVFLQHGLLSSSVDWIVIPTEEALGYKLADAGYDVWLGNARGNTYGRRHTKLDPDNDSAFWKFSFDELGQIDVPAQLRYILNITGQDKISYVGHSQGTMTFWIAMETNPDLQSSIDLMFALGPVSRVANMKSPLRKILPYMEKYDLILEHLGLDEFMPSNKFFELIGEDICEDGSELQPMCANVLFLIAGYDPSGLNETLLPVLMSHTPAGTSTQNIVHFAQEVNHGGFLRYDFGRLGNIKHYGQPTPPLYDPTKVTVPVYLMWAQNDWLAVPEDVAWLATQLPNIKENIRIARDEFNHLDFLWASDADTLCYDLILDRLKRL